MTASGRPAGPMLKSDSISAASICEAPVAGKHICPIPIRVGGGGR